MPHHPMLVLPFVVSDVERTGTRSLLPNIESKLPEQRGAYLYGQLANVGVINSGLKVFFSCATQWTVYRELFKRLELVEALLESNILKGTLGGTPEFDDMKVTHGAKMKI